MRQRTGSHGQRNSTGSRTADGDGQQLRLNGRTLSANSGGRSAALHSYPIVGRVLLSLAASSVPEPTVSNALPGTFLHRSVIKDAFAEIAYMQDLSAISHELACKHHQTG